MIAAGILIALGLGVAVGWQLPNGGRLMRVLALAWVADVVLLLAYLWVVVPR